MVRLLQLPGGDELYRYRKSLVVAFHGPRKVLSTGPNNGGYRTDLQAVFNHDCNPDSGERVELKTENYREYMDVCAREKLGLDPKSCTGLATAASMDHVSIQTMTYEDFSVTAIVTGGIEVNGGRVGDVAEWHEKDEVSYPVKMGTINIILCIDADLSESALVRAMITCTEAKTAVLQELLASSRYSRGIATGSGTDGTILVCNAASEVHLTNAGKHCKLGEYIGKTVKTAVKEALELHTGLNGSLQHDAIRRMERFGVTDEAVWACYLEQTKTSMEEKAVFMKQLEQKKTESELVIYTSLYAHLLDQFDWGLLDAQEVWKAGKELLHLAGMETSYDEKILENEWEKEEWFEWLVERYRKGLAQLVSKDCSIDKKQVL